MSTIMSISRFPAKDSGDCMISKDPPDGLPTYRVLTGPDDATFCRRVSEALSLGYKLYGSPAATFNGENVVLAQAIIWPSIEPTIASP